MVHRQVRGVPSGTGTEVADTTAGHLSQDFRAGACVLPPGPGETVGNSTVTGGTGAPVVMSEACGSGGHLPHPRGQDHLVGTFDRMSPEGTWGAISCSVRVVARVA